MTRSRLKNDFSIGIDDSATSTKLTVTNSGVAGTLTTAAQPNITSVGTLTGFTSTGIDDNATSTALTIGSDEDATFSGGVKLDGRNASIGLKLDMAGSDDYVIKESSSNDIMQYGGGTATALYHSISSGTLRLGTAGGGISFNGDTAAANALDDYEEGSWTPTTVQGASINNIDTGNCRYTKIGNTVHIRGEFWNFSSTNSSALIMGGLPYTVANGVESSFPIMYHQVNLDSGYTQLTGYAQSNTNNFRLYESGDAVNWSALRGDQCGSSTDFIFAITYEAA